jgi:hypothetical protein
MVPKHFQATREAILPVVASGAFRFEQVSAERSADESQQQSDQPAIDTSRLSVALCKPHGALGGAIVAIVHVTAVYVIAFVLRGHSAAYLSRKQ